MTNLFLESPKYNEKSPKYPDEVDLQESNKIND